MVVTPNILTNMLTLEKNSSAVEFLSHIFLKLEISRQGKGLTREIRKREILKAI